MGDEQKLTPEEQIRTAREAFEEAEDFTVAVEEEFAILDPETLGLANRFEELQAAAVGTELEPHLVGELIASEIEIRTGRCADFTEAAARMGERRDQLLALADQMGVVLGGTGTHPGARGRSSGSSTRRTTAATTRSSATSCGATTASGSTCTSRSTA